LIKNIKIANYQSHAETAIELCPNVNIIVGENNSGKTAIFRALNWMFFNRPAGGKMFHNFAGKEGAVQVEVVTAEDNTIGLQKLVKINKNGKKQVGSSQYYLDDLPFEGFGSKVPDIIADTLKMSDLNIQRQLEGPFLITSSPGEIARTINRITNLDHSDAYIRVVNQRIALSKSTMELLEVEKTELDKRKKEFEGLDNIGKMLAKLDTVIYDIDDKHSKSIEIMEAHDYLDYIADIIDNFPDLDEIDRKLAQVDNLDHKIAVKTIEMRGLFEFVEIEEELEKVIDVEGLGDSMNRCELIDYEIKEKRRAIGEAQKYIRLVDDLDMAAVLLADESVIFKDMLKKAKICPLCNTKLTAKHMEKVLDEVSSN
jgi:DNA repair exonuclease SbcCD ATPase subunit